MFVEDDLALLNCALVACVVGPRIVRVVVANERRS